MKQAIKTVTIAVLAMAIGAFGALAAYELMFVLALSRFDNTLTRVLIATWPNVLMLAVWVALSLATFMTAYRLLSDELHTTEGLERPRT